MASDDALHPRSVRGRLRATRLRASQAVTLARALATDRLRPIHAELDGEHTLAGPNDTVRILRDGHGVPHCFASNPDDAYFALGFVHGQDRAWQMEFLRRAVQGRMAEVTGPPGLPTDRLLRHVGIHRAAKPAWDAMTGEDQDRFLPYVAGVNAAFALAPPPLECRLLGYEPEPWRAEDSVLWAKMLSFMLAPSWEAQVLRARVVEVAGVEAVRSVDPGYPAHGPVIRPPGAPYGALSDSLLEAHHAAAAAALLGGPGIGSNNWAVAPGRAGGAALFACDPHLSPVFPSYGYFVHLECPEYTVAGASVPGLPGVIWGHNRHIAWGPTAGLAALQDVFVEEFEDGSDRYRTPDGFAQAEVVEETIKVRGFPDEVRRVRITRHGPVISPAVPGTRHALALRSSVLDPVTSGRGLLGLLTASNIDEFRAAVQGFADFNLVFAYADRQGHVGIQTSGRIPLRAPGSAWLPAPGWDPAFDLDIHSGDGGYVPFDDLPHFFDPADGVVWSANNAPAPVDALPFDGEFLDAYRATRIASVIKSSSSHTLDDARTLQTDRLSIPLRQLADYLAGIQPAGAREEKLLAAVRAWDGVMAADSVPAAVVAATFARLYDAVLRARLGPATDVYLGGVHAIPNLNFVAARGASLVLGLLQDAPPDWFGPPAPGASGRAIWTAALTRAFRDAVALLHDRLGRDPGRWTWGRCHRLSLAHALHDEPILARLFDVGPFDFAGDGNTVWQAGPVSTDPFAATSAIPALRLLVSLTDPPRAEFALAGGQSGQRGARHDRDLLDDWRNGRTRPLLTDPAEIERAASHRLTLHPAGKSR